MAGPTAEVLNDDIKALREDLHKLETSLKAEIHRVDVGLARLQTEFGLAKWLLGFLLVATFSGVGSGIWWASKINTKVDGLAARFDKLEASIGKILEQTKPAEKAKL